VRPAERAVAKLTKRNHRPGRPNQKEPRSIKSKAAGGSVGQENVAGDSDIALRTKWTGNQLIEVKNVTSSLLG